MKNKQTILLIFIAVVISVVGAFALYIKHNPTEKMIKQQNDLERSQDLDYIYIAVRSLLKQGESIPDSLYKVNVAKAGDLVPALLTDAFMEALVTEVKNTRSGENSPVGSNNVNVDAESGEIVVSEKAMSGIEKVKDIKHDPKTGEIYRYRVVSDNEIELCAEFETDTRSLRDNRRFIENHNESREDFLFAQTINFELGFDYESQKMVNAELFKSLGDPYLHQAGLSCFRYSF